MSPLPPEQIEALKKKLPTDSKRLLWMYQLGLAANRPAYLRVLLEEIELLNKEGGLSSTMNVNTFDEEFWSALKDRMSKRLGFNVDDLCIDGYTRAKKFYEARGWGVDYGPPSDLSKVQSIKEMDKNRKSNKKKLK